MPLKGLGKGLGALLGDFDLNDNDTTSATNKAEEIAIDKIDRNDDQPRKNFDEVALTELVNSIRIHGVITPIILVPRGDRYMIIAGERRWRASKRAGLLTIPAIVRNYTNEQIREISLIENLQREDLNPIETATAIKQLMDECDYTHEKVAERIGKSRTLVTNTLGLLTLPPRVIELIAAGRLSAGHAKVLIALDDPEAQTALALKGADGKLSVRKFEELVKAYRNPKKKVVVEQSIELKDLVARMQRAFATKVSVLGNDKKGRIYIDYYNRDDLDRITDILESIESRE
ncbi:MAG: ParB/RepB/Spo0J family partition protein [Clostridia bacterium]|nr:ParB/RepB/Spo0J family partition protein [Clostridia bacterium]